VRNALAKEIEVIAAEDERVVLLAGDIGNRLFDSYKERFPNRFYNCGVAEANMMGVAAGMALSGLRPVVYSIVPFITTRCLEQIRLDLCYHNVPVVIAGVGGGLSYAELGASHHSCEDIAFLRAIPNMSIVCPGDAWEVRAGLRACLDHAGPTYLRLGKKGEPLVHERAPHFQLGRAISIRTGQDVCLLSTGNMLSECGKVADVLAMHGISTEVVSFHTVKPIDTTALARVFGNFPVVGVVEEHSLIGGLGSAIAEWLVENPHPIASLCRFGSPDVFLHEAGKQAYARERFGLSAAQIAEQLLTKYQKVKATP
jgi:transketolase